MSLDRLRDIKLVEFHKTEASKVCFFFGNKHLFVEVFVRVIDEGQF